MKPHTHIRPLTHLALIFTLLTGTQAMAQSTPEDTSPPNLIEYILAEYPDKFSQFTDDPVKYKLQILLTVVDDAAPDHPTITRHGYRLEEEYFYPASSIKTFAAAAALIRLKGLREETGLPIDHTTPIVIHPLFDDEKLQDTDPSNVATGKITVEHEIRKTLLVSSNSAYNHLFEFVGHQPIHDTLTQAGLPEVRLNHRLSEFRSPEDNRRSPRIDFILDDGTTYTLPERTSTLITDNAGLAGLSIGDAYMSGDQRIDEPLNFLNKNHASLEDLQNFLIMIARPDITPSLDDTPDESATSGSSDGISEGDETTFGTGGGGLSRRLPLTDHDRTILLSALSQHPHESINPVYTGKDISEAGGYPLYQPGLERIYPRKDLLLYAKGGTAYGFKIANASITHKPTGKTFFLAATLYTNPNNTLNDDQYDYDLANQFLADLAEAVARELWE